MNVEKYDELRRHIKDELGTLMENTPDKNAMDVFGLTTTL